MPKFDTSNLKFSTAQVAEMTGIDQGRVQHIIKAYNVPHMRTSGGPAGPGHIRLSMEQVEQIVKWDDKAPKVGRNRKLGPSIEQYEALVQRVETLEQIIDEFTAPEVAHTASSR